jgi:arabinose-5-phosphate isomerase
LPPANLHAKHTLHVYNFAMNTSALLDPAHILSSAQRTFAIEVDALQALGGRLDQSFVEATKLLVHCQGRVVVTGIGKSGHVARKIAATLASTGTPRFFHARCRSPAR